MTLSASEMRKQLTDLWTRAQRDIDAELEASKARASAIADRYAQASRAACGANGFEWKGSSVFIMGNRYNDLYTGYTNKLDFKKR